MAKGKKTGGRNFIAGNSGNPGGRPPLPEDLKGAAKLSPVLLEAMLNRFIWMTKDDLQSALRNPAASMLEVMIGSIVAKAATGADHQRLTFLLDRLIGKVKEPAQDINMNLSTMPRHRVIEIGKEAIKYLQTKHGQGSEQ